MIRKGRFNEPAAEIAQRYAESVSFDWRLYRYDIAGSIAHAAALAGAGIITAEERRKIENGLREIEKEIVSGKFEWDPSLEDVHMNIEAALTKRIGAAGALAKRTAIAAPSPKNIAAQIKRWRSDLELTDEST
jgi:argininosuccinate lyase